MRLPASAFVLSTLLLTTLPVAVLPAQDSVRIVKVPENLRLPAPPGSNLLLEVEVGGAPDAIWLATDATAQDRLPLQAVGQQRGQVNLADARLFDLLPAGRDQGSLFVHARFGNRTVQSPAIGWSRATTDDGKVRCVVRTRGKPTRTVPPDEPVWIDPTTLERLELQGAGARQSAAVARLEDLELPFVRRAEEKVWVLDVDAKLRERFVSVPAFEVELRLGAASALFEFRCVPPKLDLTDPVTTFVVQQRKKVFVPGSRDWLTVHIDDITGGHVLFEIVAADGAIVVPQRFVRDRDHVEFQLASGRYVLTVQKLVNLLIGDDHAELAVQDAATFRQDRIDQLLTAIEASGDTFLREGKEYEGSMAAQFLIAKLGSHRGKPPDVAEFVEQFASRSSKTGEPYSVRTKDGTVVTMRDWLAAALKAIESAETKVMRK